MKAERGRIVLLAIVVGGSLTARAAGGDGDVPPRPRVFRIQVVDDQTGRGVPLVELRTVNQIRFLTDSNGVAAFDEPGLFDRKVFFLISSHGYEAPKDNYGYRGQALQVTAGGSSRIAIRRNNIAERLYRVTGEGIYRDSVLTGDRVPIREPLLNGMVFGQDSVVNAVYLGKVHWFWGDTNRPDYPLGNFHVPGATSELPGRGGLDPEAGVDLSYFLDDKGLARPTAPIPGDGPTWISGLVVLRDRGGNERMFANYAKVRNMLDVYQHGLAEFHPESQRFQKVAQFPDAARHPGDYPSGHAFLHRDNGVDYVYYANPFPLIRVPADPDQLANPSAFESFTALVPGTTRAQHQLERGADGLVHYGWKRNTQVLTQEAQNRLISAGRMTPWEALLNLRDVDTGKTVLGHGGSVYWNEFRRRWVMIAVESFGSSSFLGEIWYAEADSPLGPWVYARKVVTHDKYSFYNPKQHPMFDKEGGRIVFFEGTYTTTFSGNNDPTPRYDYNQVMYRLDLSDPRMALPVAIYEAPASGTIRLVALARGPDRGAAGRPAASGAEARASGPRRVLFFAPDRPGIANIPVYDEVDPAGGHLLRVGAAPTSASEPHVSPSFYLLPDDQSDRNPATVRLFEYREGQRGRRYVVESPDHPGRLARGARVLGRVWPNPGRPFPW